MKERMKLYGYDLQEHLDEVKGGKTGSGTSSNEKSKPTVTPRKSVEPKK